MGRRLTMDPREYNTAKIVNVKAHHALARLNYGSLKFQRIKEARLALGCDLKEAKEWVERLFQDCGKGELKTPEFYEYFFILEGGDDPDHTIVLVRSTAASKSELMSYLREVVKEMILTGPQYSLTLPTMREVLESAQVKTEFIDPIGIYEDV
jgi:hypothetical protein